jgi:hypothetical protein
LFEFIVKSLNIFSAHILRREQQEERNDNSSRTTRMKKERGTNRQRITDPSTGIECNS